MRISVGSVNRKGDNCVLRVVVVPRAIIMIQKSEEFTLVFLESLLPFNRKFGFPILINHLLVESINVLHVFIKISFPKSHFINRIYNVHHQIRESLYEHLIFLIKLVGKQVTIQVPYQMVYCNDFINQARKKVNLEKFKLTLIL
jgi:hypothetical protein